MCWMVWWWRSIIAHSAESWTDSLVMMRSSIELRSFSMSARVSGVGSLRSVLLDIFRRLLVGWLCFLVDFPMFRRLSHRSAQVNCDKCYSNSDRISTELSWFATYSAISETGSPFISHFIIIKIINCIKVMSSAPYFNYFQLDSNILNIYLLRFNR